MNFVPDDITYWMNVAGSRPVLSQEQIDQIAKVIQSEPVNSKKYKDNVNKLTEHNLRLVIRFVKLFVQAKTRRNWDQVETVDYLQVGTMGLIRAVEKYDPTRGYKFSTYATYWIRSFVTRHSIKTSSVFSIPEEACRRAYQYRAHGYIKSKDGIKTDASVEKGKQLNDLVTAAQSAISLYMPIEENSSNSLIDILASPDTSHKAADIAYAKGLTRGQYQSLRRDALDKLRSVLGPV